ncbi:hypothetical protein [Amycolatopsis alkalitolerans]|uniref:Uncharacterized protein n=1 Tax=Amycolatopsis alkalitolerans TaxID=2547244 RepID=A0A5C4M9C3_9PSEU|nr:hypothetical protein [Amycolatopsis alkalitolerans]TNC29726.1 hypothetical protein FG385_01900 [Amycolatopsis alkalitolerans]
MMAQVRRPDRGTLAGITVLVVLALGCALTYQHFASRLPDLNYQTLAATGEEGRMARDGLALAGFGESDGYDYVHTFTQVVAMKFLSDHEIAAFRQGQPSAARAKVAETPRGRVVAVVVKMASPQAARDAAAALDRLQVDAGMRRAPAPPGVHRVEIGGASPDGRVHYAHGQLLVRVDLAAAPGVPLGPAFTQVIGSQLEELSADA